MVSRGFAALIRVTFRFRFLAFATGAYVFARFVPFPNRRFAFWSLAFAAAVASIAAFSTVPKIVDAKYPRRRRREGAIAGLLALDLIARGGPEWMYLFAFPLFLFFVFLDHRLEDLLLYLFVWGAFNFPDSAITFVLLGGTTLLASLLRSRERRAAQKVTERLHVYERESHGLEAPLETPATQMAVDAGDEAHRVEVIRGRELDFHTLTSVLFQTLRPHSCALYLFDPIQDRFLLKDWLTESSQFSDRRVQAPLGLFRMLLTAERPIRMESPKRGVLRGLPYYVGEPPVSFVMALPLRSQDALKGVLVVDRKERQPFTEAECLILTQIADQLLRSIENAELIHTYFQLQQQLAAFYEASGELNRSLQVEDVAKTLLEANRKIAEYDWSALILHDPSTRRNVLFAEGGSDHYGWESTEFACAPERGLLSWVIQYQTPLAYDHFRQRQAKAPLFHRQWKVPNIYDSLLIFPLHCKGTPLGAVVYASRANRFFSKRVREMLEVIATMGGTALHNARMVRELERMATTDGLTGVANHRKFQEALSSELDRAGRHPAAVSLLLLDIDHFKRFNDEYGHPVGDQVLKKIGDILKRTVRKIDTVARYGGEEFAVILVNTHAKGAEHMADRIVREVSSHKFLIQEMALRVTASVGAATFPDDAFGREDLIECADRALYEAKRLGRNRAVVYRSELGKVASIERENRMIGSAEDVIRQSARAH